MDQALGRAAEALTFRRPPTPWLARLAFFEPISAPEDMARVTTDVAAKLCARLETEGPGRPPLRVFFHRVDGKTLRWPSACRCPAATPAASPSCFHPSWRPSIPASGREREHRGLRGRAGRRPAGQPGGRLPRRWRTASPRWSTAWANRLGPERVWRAARPRATSPN
jgi:protein ImuB